MRIPFGGREIFEREGDAVQQAGRYLPHEDVFGGLRRGKRLVAADGEVCVQLGVESVNAVEKSPHHLHR